MVGGGGVDVYIRDVHRIDSSSRRKSSIKELSNFLNVNKYIQINLICLGRPM